MSQDSRVQAFVTAFEGLRAEVEKVIVGHREVITHVLTGMFAGGHVLLEGVPGLGKTLLIKTLSEGLDLSFFKLRVRYPQIEELNSIIDRTTQSRTATVNRVLGGPDVLSFRELIREVPIASHVRDFASAIVMATHPQWEQAPDVARRFVRYGASPRGAQALVLGAKVRALADGRYNVSVEDIKAMAVPALRHRVILNFEGEAEGVDTDTLVSRVVADTEAGVAHSREPFLR